MSCRCRRRWPEPAGDGGRAAGGRCSLGGDNAQTALQSAIGKPPGLPSGERQRGSEPREPVRPWRSISGGGDRRAEGGRATPLGGPHVMTPCGTEASGPHDAMRTSGCVGVCGGRGGGGSGGQRRPQRRCRAPCSDSAGVPAAGHHRLRRRDVLGGAGDAAGRQGAGGGAAAAAAAVRGLAAAGGADAAGSAATAAAAAGDPAAVPAARRAAGKGAARSRVGRPACRREHRRRHGRRLRGASRRRGRAPREVGRRQVDVRRRPGPGRRIQRLRAMDGGGRGLPVRRPGLRDADGERLRGEEHLPRVGPHRGAAAADTFSGRAAGRTRRR
mmetsp:Transcript_44852/g.126552  ORF Transcript_44852/g.126552 Transcript_44852/m.126552 type:complete len:329 (+) Transcript_44852:227-1213(+)